MSCSSRLSGPCRTHVLYVIDAKTKKRNLKLRVSSFPVIEEPVQ